MDAGGRRTRIGRTKLRDQSSEILSLFRKQPLLLAVNINFVAIGSYTDDLAESVFLILTVTAAECGSACW